MPTSPPQHRPAFTPTKVELRKASNKHYNKNVRENQDFYNSKEWRDLRAWFVKKHPLCVTCRENGIAKLVQIVDHIVEIKDGGSLLCVTNLMSMCIGCHNTKSAHEATQRGRAGKKSTA